MVRQRAVSCASEGDILFEGIAGGKLLLEIA